MTREVKSFPYLTFYLVYIFKYYIQYIQTPLKPSKINALAESYPELKSNENYNTLQLTIVDVEEHLQAARRLYNSNVSNYNQMIKVFPNSIIAGSKGCKEKEFFVAEEAKKEDVKIDLI